MNGEQSFEAFITGPGPAHDLRSAEQWLVGRMLRHGEPGLVIVHTRSSEDYDPEIARLKATGAKVETNRTMGGVHRGAVLVVRPDKKLLAKVDAMPGKTAMCVANWLPSETQAWAEARSAVDLSTGQQVESEETADPVVSEAVRGLSNVVNVSSCLSDPRDRDRAIDTFRKLQVAGYSWTEEEVQSLALKNGWPARGANALTEYATGVAGGRNYRTKYTLGSDVVAYWREKVANK